MLLFLSGLYDLIGQPSNVFVTDYHPEEKNTFESVMQLNNQNYLVAGTIFSNNGYNGTYVQLLLLDTLGNEIKRDIMGSNGTNHILVGSDKLRNGFFYLSGYDSNKDSLNSFISLINKEGKIIWTKKYLYDELYQERLLCSASSKDYAILTISLLQHKYNAVLPCYIVRKINLEGNIVFQKCIPYNVNYSLNSLLEFPNGNICAFGSYYSYDSIQNKYINYILFLYMDKDGNTKEVKTYNPDNGISNITVKDAILSKEGNFIITGTNYTARLNYDMKIIWESKLWGGKALSETQDLDLIVTGSEVYNLSVKGDLKFKQNPDIDMTNTIPTFDGGFLVIGKKEENFQHYYGRIVKTDCDGNWIFSKKNCPRYLPPEGCEDLIFYPNPSKDNIYLLTANEIKEEVKAEIITCIGSRVYLTNSVTQNLINIDISNLATGIYILRIWLGNSILVDKKVVKE
jgi:hypothetical protein